MGYALEQVGPIHNKTLARSRDGYMSRILERSPIGEVVYVVEQDGASRQGMCESLRSLGFLAESFDTLESYLGHVRFDCSACLILNLRTLDSVGREFQRRLRAANTPPVIFMTGICDTSATVQAMKAGAVEVLCLPVERRVLGAAIREAFARDVREQKEQAERMGLKQRLATLTPREREVLPLIAAGLLNK